MMLFIENTRNLKRVFLLMYQVPVQNLMETYYKKGVIYLEIVKSQVRRNAEKFIEKFNVRQIPYTIQVIGTYIATIPDVRYVTQNFRLVWQIA